MSTIIGLVSTFRLPLQGIDVNGQYNRYKCKRVQIKPSGKPLTTLRARIKYDIIPKQKYYSIFYP